MWSPAQIWDGYPTAEQAAEHVIYQLKRHEKITRLERVELNRIEKEILQMGLLTREQRKLNQVRMMEICSSGQRKASVKQLLDEGLATSGAQARRIFDSMKPKEK